MKFVLASLGVIGLVYGIPVEIDLFTQTHVMPEAEMFDTGNGSPNDIQSRIVNGERAKGGQFPWQAWLVLEGITNKKGSKKLPYLTKTHLMCGASLISKQHLITAAHCLIHYDAQTEVFWNCTNIYVELGSTRMTSGAGVNTTEYFIHPEWNEDDLKNDIAIIRLPIAYDRIKGYNPKSISPISLPTLSDRYNDFTGQNAIASGFGNTYFEDKDNDKLNYVSLKVISNTACRIGFFPLNIIDETKICTSADKRPKASACFGDSGGPLVISKSTQHQILIGVASFGHVGCSGLTVFSRITSYMDFICQYATDLKKYCGGI